MLDLTRPAKPVMKIKKEKISTKKKGGEGILSRSAASGAVVTLLPGVGGWGWGWGGDLEVGEQQLKVEMWEPVTF